MNNSTKYKNENYFFSHLKNMIFFNNHSLYKYHEIVAQVTPPYSPRATLPFPAKNSRAGDSLFFFIEFIYFLFQPLKLIYLFTLYLLVLYISF